jgi:hypothetical protein
VIKFYADTHIAKAVAVQLRLRGVDIVRCEEVDMTQVDDEALPWPRIHGQINLSKRLARIVEATDNRASKGDVDDYRNPPSRQK